MLTVFLVISYGFATQLILISTQTQIKAIRKAALQTLAEAKKQFDELATGRTVTCVMANSATVGVKNAILDVVCIAFTLYQLIFSLSQWSSSFLVHMLQCVVLVLCVAS